MKSSFRKRVFYLLLIFAVIPAMILTLFGYYLLSETPHSTDSQEADQLVDLTSYYHDLLYSRIEAAIEQYLSDTTASGTALDFLAAIDNHDVRHIFISDEIPGIVLTAVQDALTEKTRGVIAVDSAFVQFVSIAADDGTTVVGGFVYESQYADLIESIRQDIGTRVAGHRLLASYVTFVGGLLLTVTIVTILLAYYASSRVSRKIADPVTALSTASRQIATGDFQQHISPAGDDEMKALIENFNNMATALDQITTRLAQTERVAAWRQVARRFAHELKNPLQPILVSLYRIEQQLAESGALDDVLDPLRAASEEVKHLTTLADRFSSLAKLPPPKMESVNLNQLISSVADLYKEKLSLFDFQLELPTDEITFVSDQAYLREGLHNLLQNAMDACADSGGIGLRFILHDTRVDIVVTDTGAGMDDKTLSSARLPYFTTKSKGSGLGLAIVEKSINELGGQLHVVSEIGKGTSVTISLNRDNT